MKAKLIIIPVVALAIFSILGIAGIGKVKANSEQKDSFIQKLATKFNLNQDEVQKFFDEFRQERHQEMQKNMEEKLDQAVKNNKITNEQKGKILEKMQEMKKEGNDQSSSKKGQSRQLHKEEMEKWAQENNIDLNLLRPFGKGLKKDFKEKNNN
ncbi:MAG: hypothetical protein PHN19_04815 [Patescibacteria group bacterium]|nr:hypothetical protein [Patescibacteria group bacterium]